MPTALNGSHVKCTDPDHHGCPLCTAPADAHLEAAMRKLRANTGEFKPRLLWAEAAALLAYLTPAVPNHWNADDVLKRHGLYRELAPPDRGATALRLMWLEQQNVALLAKIEGADRLLAWPCKRNDDFDRAVADYFRAPQPAGGGE